MDGNALALILFIYVFGCGICIGVVLIERDYNRGSTPGNAYFSFVALWPIMIPLLVLRTIIKGSWYMLRHL